MATDTHKTPDTRTLKDECYSNLERACKVLDRHAKAFVYGLETLAPDAYNELANIACDANRTYEFVHAVSACMAVAKINQVSYRNIIRAGKTRSQGAQS